MSYYDLAWYFIIYSFVGWCVEVVYKAVTRGKIINSGMLNGPVCPIYGFGVCALLLLCQEMSGLGNRDINDVELFFIGMAVCTLVELIGGYGLDRIWHMRWWDYSKRPFNFHGYICAEFSILWGLGVVLVVRVVHPNAAVQFTSWMPQSTGTWILVILYLWLFIDLIVTVAILIGLNKKIHQLDRMEKTMRVVSDSISENIAESAIYGAQRVQYTRVQAELAKNEISDKKDETIEQLYSQLMKHKMLRRIVLAFPDLESHDMPETLSQLAESIKGKVFKA